MNSFLILSALWLTPFADLATSSAADVGGEIPYFYVREVTGSRPNLATCLVCRYGARPVALVCVRQLDSQGEKLLAAIDRAVDAGRGQGLKGFAIFLAETPGDVQPRMMSLARQQKLSMPLTFPVEAGGPRALGLSNEANLTVLCYTHKKVVSRHVFHPRELTDARIDEVVAAVKLLTAEM